MADHTLRDIDETRHVMVSPVVWTELEENLFALRDEGVGRFGVRTIRVDPVKQWYFCVAAASTTSDTGFWIDQYKSEGEDRPTCVRMRAALIEELKRRSMDVVEFDDELVMAKHLRTRFPCERTRKMVRVTEQERATGEWP